MRERGAEGDKRRGRGKRIEGAEEDQKMRDKE